MTNYYTQYEMLNEEQKAAVDYNQGPFCVLVREREKRDFDSSHRSFN